MGAWNFIGGLPFPKTVNLADQSPSSIEATPAAYTNTVTMASQNATPGGDRARRRPSNSKTPAASTSRPARRNTMPSRGRIYRSPSSIETTPAASSSRVTRLSAMSRRHEFFHSPSSSDSVIAAGNSTAVKRNTTRKQRCSKGKSSKASSKSSATVVCEIPSDSEDSELSSSNEGDEYGMLQSKVQRREPRRTVSETNMTSVQNKNKLRYRWKEETWREMLIHLCLAVL